jgi:tRNA 2-thiocytidine biosynthesis protein TtcA
LVYCQENDIAAFAKEMAYPIIPCTLCGSQENLVRKKVKHLIDQLALENPKVPSNILHALSAIKPSQLMDKKFWDFKNLEKQSHEAEGARGDMANKQLNVSGCSSELFEL